jgi:hypothetical protein
MEEEEQIHPQFWCECQWIRWNPKQYVYIYLIRRSNITYPLYGPVDYFTWVKVPRCTVQHLLQHIINVDNRRFLNPIIARSLTSPRTHLLQPVSTCTSDLYTCTDHVSQTCWTTSMLATFEVCWMPWIEWSYLYPVLSAATLCYRTTVSMLLVLT